MPKLCSASMDRYLNPKTSLCLHSILTNADCKYFVYVCLVFCLSHPSITNFLDVVKPYMIWRWDPVLSAALHEWRGSVWTTPPIHPALFSAAEKVMMWVMLCLRLQWNDPFIVLQWIRRSFRTQPAIRFQDIKFMKCLKAWLVMKRIRKIMISPYISMKITQRSAPEGSASCADLGKSKMEARENTLLHVQGVWPMVRKESSTS